MNLSIAEIIRATEAINGGFKPDLEIRRVSTDTRRIQSQDLYVALKGENFDGHAFCAEALNKGAAGVVISSGASKPEGPHLIVKDTLRALGDMAQAWRMKLSMPVVAITGSAGKTTTKELVAAVLRASGSVGKTEGNLNNLIGVPLTLFSIDASQKFAVVEMGMNAFGEIKRLTEIAAPAVGLITNVARAHLEGVGSIEGVAKAKGELFEGLSPQSIALVNADDPFVSRLPTKARRVTYGFGGDCDIRGLDLKIGSESMHLKVRAGGRTREFTLPFVGEYLARNFLAAFAVAHVLGIEVVPDSLEDLQFLKRRGQAIELKRGITVVDDCYNANPEAMEAAFGAFQSRFPQRRRIVVLGDMFELGAEAAKLHREVGGMAAKTGMDLLLAVGQYAADYAEGFGPSARVFRDIEDLSRDLDQELKVGDAVLVKGSRGARMERVVEELSREA